MDQQQELSERDDLRELLMAVLKAQELILHRLEQLEERLERRSDAT
jgi:hypothetical protein